MDIKFIFRQYIKTAVHHFFLPAVYRIYCKKPVRKGSVILLTDIMRQYRTVWCRCMITFKAGDITFKVFFRILEKHLICRD